MNEMQGKFVDSFFNLLYYQLIQLTHKRRLGILNQRLRGEFMNIKTKTITILAVALALMFALTPIPFVSLFLVPVLFIGLTHKWHLGAITGLMFGLVSLMYAFVMPTGIVAFGFQAAPWIAIVPRIFVGLFTALSFNLFRRLIKPKGKVSKILPYNLAATVGTITNTILVIGMFFAMTAIDSEFPRQYPYSFTVLFLGTVSLFVAIELVVANIIAAPVSFAVAKALKLGEFSPKILDASCLAQDSSEELADSKDSILAESEKVIELQIENEFQELAQEQIDAN